MMRAHSRAFWTLALGGSIVLFGCGRKLTRVDVRGATHSLRVVGDTIRGFDPDTTTLKVERGDTVRWVVAIPGLTGMEIDLGANSPAYDRVLIGRAVGRDIVAETVIRRSAAGGTYPYRITLQRGNRLYMMDPKLEVWP